MTTRKCIIDGCDSPLVAKGWCRKHYLRHYKTGDPLKAKRDRTPEERFWPHVDKRGPDECWPFVPTPKRYGVISLGAKTGRAIGAHRLSYILHYGPIADDLLVMHSCDNPACCNPAHLSAGTPKENMDDMHRKGRARPGRVLGEAKSGTKLNNDAVRYIRANRDISSAALAGRFGVSTHSICDVWNGKYWAHVA